MGAKGNTVKSGAKNEGLPKTFKLPLVNPFPKNSVEHKVLEAFRRSSVLTIERIAKVCGGTLVAGLIQPALRVLQDPLHPDNNWSALLESIEIDGVKYYRLVQEIPMAVKEEWARRGKPPVVSLSWVPPEQEDDAKEPSETEWMVDQFNKKHPRHRRE